jgi:hypothetical protein
VISVKGLGGPSSKRMADATPVPQSSKQSGLTKVQFNPPKTTSTTSSEFEKLRAALVKPDMARRIFGKLKHVDTPSPHTDSPSQKSQPNPGLIKAMCLDTSDVYNFKEATRAGSRSPPAVLDLLSKSKFMPTPGGMATVGGIIAAMGAFDVAAGVTGKLVGRSGAHENLVPPTDRMSILVCKCLTTFLYAGHTISLTYR